MRQYDVSFSLLLNFPIGFVFIRSNPKRVMNNKEYVILSLTYFRVDVKILDLSIFLFKMRDLSNTIESC